MSQQIVPDYDNLLEGIQIIDYNWNFVYVNKTLCQQANMSKKKLLGNNIKDLFPSIEKTTLFTALKNCMKDRKVFQLQNEYTFGDSTKKWFQLTIKPIKEGICILSLDINRFRKEEEKAQKLSKLYAFISQVNQNIVHIKEENALFKNSCQMAITFGKFKVAWIGLFDDEIQNIAVVAQGGSNKIELQKYNLSKNDYAQNKVLLTSKHFICTDIVNDIQLENWKPFIQKHAIGSCIILPIRKSNAIVGTLNLYSNELDFDSKEIALLVEIAKDISYALDRFEAEKKHRRDEEIALQKNEELEKTNYELDRFVYSVSHDLRSPLTSILGLLAFIQEDSKEPETLKHTEMIRNSINRLDEFIKNILSYSRNNRMELAIEKVPLEQTTEEIVTSLLHSKEAQNIAFKIEVEEVCPFYSDKQSYSTIIENMVSNAIKFQDKNKEVQFIKIKAYSEGDYLNLTITDNGIGIDKENYSKIFDMFKRLSGDVAGSGIGLYIVKEIVTKIEGTITVQSKIGEETTFTIQLKNLKPC